MMNSKTACKIWKDLVSIYKKDVGNGTPKATVKKLIDKWGLWNTKQIFAIITAIKEHDGRISVENREKLSQIPVDPACTKWDSNNQLVYAGVDEIHTSHINQMISAIFELEDNLDPPSQHLTIVQAIDHIDNNTLVIAKGDKNEYWFWYVDSNNHRLVTASNHVQHLAERDYKKLLNDYRSLTIVGLGSALESFDMSPNNFPADPFDDGDCLIVLLVYRWFIYQYAK